VRKLAVSLLLALAVVVGAEACSASTQSPTPWTETQACSGGTCAGTLPVIGDAGMSLAYVDSFRLGVCAASGQTLSGAGSMLAVWGNSAVNLPFRNNALDQLVTTSGSRCATFPDIVVGEVTPEPDYVIFEASGVTVSGGAALSVYLYPHRGH
jgi:hypothetical protein